MPEALRLPRRLPAATIAAILALTWLVAGPRTPDLAAAVYRAGLFTREGLRLYDPAWYGGHLLPGYGVVYTAVAALLGVRLTGVLAATTSALMFERLAGAWWGRRAGRLAAVWFAVASVTDLVIGRLTYGLGVTVGLAALLALERRHPRVAAVLACACAATSPVAGVFLGLVAGASWLVDRRRRGSLGVAVAATAAVTALALAFPEGGSEPFSVGAMLAVLVFPGAVALLSGPEQRELRVGTALYAAAAIGTFLIPTPLGGNISRLGAEFAGPVLVGILAARLRPLGRAGWRAAAAALVAISCWQWLAPVQEVAKTIGDDSYRAAYYAPVIQYLSSHTAGPLRLEVPFTRSHWEAVFVARRFMLARGWETQLDVEYNRLFYDRGVNRARYRAWLLGDAVGYIAVPDAPLDPSSKAEARLIAGGLPYLAEIWRSAHWVLYRVRGAAALVDGPARLVDLEADHFDMIATKAGEAVVRVRFTPYWTVVTGGCATRAPGGWTRVSWAAAGRVEVAATFSLDQLLDGGSSCRPVR